MKDPKELMRTLKDLQNITREIFNIRLSINGSSKKINHLKSILDKDIAEFKALTKSRDDMQNQSKNKKEYIETLKKEIKTLRDKEKQIQTMREFEALDNEQNIRKEEISILENEVKELDLEVINQDKKIEKLDAKVKENEAKIQSEKDRVDKKLNELTKELEDKVEERKVIEPTIPKALLAEFDRIAENKNGVAISKISNNFCEECNMSISPHVANQVRRMNELIHCSNCGRFLYID